MSLDTLPNTRSPRAASAAAPPARSRRPAGWWLALATLAVFLVALAYAEIDWLHQALPQDRASRVALVALPATPLDGEGDWRPRLMEEAADRGLIAAVIGNLDLRDAGGKLLSPDALAANIRLGSECIEQRAGQAPTRRGVLLYAVVRGGSTASTDAIAQEWERLFIQQSSESLPGLAIQPTAAQGAPYEFCR